MYMRGPSEWIRVEARQVLQVHSKEFCELVRNSVPVLREKFEEGVWI